MYRMILDTETCGELDCPFVYDLGFAVIDDDNEIIETHSFINIDFFDDDEMMNTAYYKEKIPQYMADISNGKRKVASLAYIHAVFRNVCKKYNINEFIAHNMRFDYNSLTNTKRYETTSKKRYWFPYGSKFIDTLKMSRNYFKDDYDYTKFCINNDYRTKNNQNRYTAEILYRYITGDNDFCEEHKGLDDVLIELEIFKHCFDKLENGYMFDKGTPKAKKVKVSDRLKDW